MGEFTGKVALVTGTTGIARATALHLAREGAEVTCLGIDEAANAALAQDHPMLHVRRADVSSPAEVEAAFAELEARSGGLDVIVNSAAVHPYGTAVSTDHETFMRCLAVNVGGVHLTARSGVPLMRRRGGGAIVNLSRFKARPASRTSRPMSPPRARSTR